MEKTSHNTPLKRIAAGLPFYYGWVILLFVIISTIVAGVGQTYGISVFNPSILKSLDISLSALTGVYMVGTLLAALPQPALGSLIDRLGHRRTMLGVVILLGASCIYFSTINSLVGLLIGFFLLRFLAHGAFTLFSYSIPAMWFRERLGTATGIVNVGFPLSVAIIPPAFLSFNNQFGWRDSYFKLGIMVWIILVPILIFVFRDKPEDVGLEMEGSIKKRSQETKVEIQEEAVFTFQEARRTSSYWIMLATTAVWTMTFAAVLFNLLPIFASQGISEKVAVSTFTTFAVASLAVQLLGGPLANRGPLNILLSICMLSFAGGLIFLSSATAPWIAQGYAILVGISNGLISLVSGTLYARYFGREHLGKINGLATTVQVAFTSMGPFITGLLYDVTGSFRIPLWIFIGILIPAALIALKASKPEKPILIKPA